MRPENCALKANTLNCCLNSEHTVTLIVICEIITVSCICWRKLSRFRISTWATLIACLKVNHTSLLLEWHPFSSLVCRARLPTNSATNRNNDKPPTTSPGGSPREAGYEDGRGWGRCRSPRKEANMRANTTVMPPSPPLRPAPPSPGVGAGTGRRVGGPVKHSREQLHPNSTRGRTHTHTHTRTQKHSRTHTHTCTHTHTHTH